MASASTLIGAAGEHYVMSELLQRDYIAALAPQGVPNVDIVVTNLTGNRQCAIQVKSRSGRGGDGGWHMKPGHETLAEDWLFYCFVDFGQTNDIRPIVYVIPSKLVAEVLYNSHRSWLSNPGKNGHTRKDSTVRRLLPNYDICYRPSVNPYPLGWLDPFKGAWAKLGLASEHEGRVC